MVRYVQAELSKLADPDKAVPMAAYMKTDMPFYGVPKPDGSRSHASSNPDFRRSMATTIATRSDLLWELPHREEKYLGDRIRLDVPPVCRLLLRSIFSSA